MRDRTPMSANAMRATWAALAAGLFCAVAHAAGPVNLVDTFTATTANMKPEGLNLRFQIIQWQDDDARAAAVEAMAAGADAATPLSKLPTVGYVWPAQSPVGYSVKYSHRAQQPDGKERITLVTDRRLGSYEFKGWTVEKPVGQETAYSVVELYLDGSGTGTGTFSHVAEVVLDEQAGSVALKDGAAAPTLLVDVKRAAERQ
jgi:hypothetical protein